MFYTFFIGLPNRVKLTAISLFCLGTVLLVGFVVSSKELNDDISMLLNASQQVTVQQLALHIEEAVDNRLQALDAVAQKLSVPLQKGASATQQYLAEVPLSQKIFNGGLIVYDVQGAPIAFALGAQVDEKLNGNYIDYVASALQEGKSAVGPPEINVQTKAPAFGMVAPIMNGQGQVVGALQGLTLLNEPHFMERIFLNYPSEGEKFLLIDPVRRLVIYASDKKRIFEQLPLQGVNTELDYLLTAATLSATANSSQQNEYPVANSRLLKNVPWLLVSEQSDSLGLVNASARQKTKWLILTLLILIGIFVIAWFYRGTMLPIQRATASLARQLQGKKRWIHNTPAARTHEIGEIIGSVNQLLSTLGQADIVLPHIDYFAKSLADNMPDVVGYWNADLRCSYANAGYQQWFGRTPEQMQGIHMKALLGEVLFAQNEPYVHAVLKGQNQQFERHFVQPNGKERDAWVQYMAHKVQGEVQGFFVFMVDITQVKTRESVARISDAALKAISQGVFIADAKQQILLINDAFARITGYEKNEILGRNCNFLQGVLTDSFLSEAMDRALRAGKGFSGELIHYRKDGSTFWNDLTISPVYNEHGQVTHFTGVVRDVTERKQMEDERLRSKMLLERDILNRSILHSLPWDLAVVNRKGKVLALNHPVQRHVSDAIMQDSLFPQEEGVRFLASAHSKKSTFLESYLAQAEDGLQAVLTASADIFQLEYPVDASSDSRWSSMIITPLGPERQAAIVARQDITNLKRAYLELQQAHIVAEKANHAKTHFLATASHDLRQPLSALSLYVGVLNKRIETEQKELVENIRGCVDSLSELLEDLLDVSKLDAGVVQPRWTDFVVDELLASQIAIHSVNAQLKGLKLRLRPSGAYVHCDPKLLTRIIGNLVTNAIRYTQQGGVLMACRQHQGAWWLEVWDTGEGIPEDKHELIFEEFQQLNQQGRTRGSGLGLAIVAKIAQLLQLEIRLRSRPGRGSVFAVKLQTAQSEHTLTVPDTIPSTTSPAMRMAVIDDDSRVLRAMAMALQGVGHQVIAAPDAPSLLRQLGEQAPEIIISDYRLGGGRTGFEAIKAVRTQFDNPALPAIVVTGDTDPALIRSMADQGIAVHFKPLKLETLQAFVKESIERAIV